MQRYEEEEEIEFRKLRRVKSNIKRVLIDDLNSCVLCEESLTAGLDKVGEKETRGVP